MSKLFRQQAAFLREDNRKHGPRLTLIQSDFTPPREDRMIAAWRSERFLVQVFEPEDGAQRISINRTMVDEVKGGWLAGITWDEIQRIKRQLGFADRYAVELYPADTDVVNVANIRHIWLVDAPAFAWKRGA